MNINELRKKKGMPPRVVVPDEPEHIPIPPSGETGAVKAPKQPKPRKCCVSMKGSDHLPTCQTLLPRPAKKGKFEEPSRLPDNARFEARYNAAEERWTVSLSAGEWTQTLTGSGIHPLLMKLGRTYFAWHKEQKGE